MAKQYKKGYMFKMFYGGDKEYLGILEMLMIDLLDVRLSWLKDDKKGSSSGDAGGEQRRFFDSIFELSSFWRQDSEQ